MHPYQAYLKLYGERVMPEIHAAFEAWNADQPPPKDEKERKSRTLSFQNKEAERRLAEESDDVKKQVEAYRRKQVEAGDEHALDLDALQALSAEEARDAVENMQK